MKLPSILICILFLQTISICQSDTKTDSSSTNYKHEIQFYIINQVIAGYKYHFTETSAFRLIINATGLFNDSKLDNVEYQTDTIYKHISRNDNTTNQFFEIKFQYLYQVRINENLNVLFGGGPLINYKFYQSENTNETIYTDNTTSGGYGRRTQNIWNTGISILLGLECMIYKNISLFTEYEASISWGWQKNSSYSNSYGVNQTIEKYKLFSYELKGLRIGVGVSF